MRALQLKSQWTRTSAAANVDAAVAASARATRSYDARGIGAVDRLHRRRAPVFMSATPSAAGAEGTATSRFVQRVRLILPHAILVSATVLYAVLGALCFTYTEQASETGHLSRYAKNAIAAQNALFSLNVPASATLSAEQRNVTEDEIDDAVDRLIQTAMEAFSEGLPATDISHSAQQKTYKVKWTFNTALYFAVTILTSVGYGNLVPISRPGRLFCIVYGTFGIPLTLITIADMAKFLSDVIAKVEANYKKRRQQGGGAGGGDKQESKRAKKSEDAEAAESEPSAAINAEEEEDDLLAEPGAWSKGFVLFLLLAYMALSALCCSFFKEAWNYTDSFYFCLITMTTIGYGDFDPALGYDPPSHYAGWICFILTGLILSTLTVDMCGSSAISSLHAFGRGIDVMGMFSVMTKGGGVAAFQPDEYGDIPYIDQKIRLSLMLEAGHYGVTYENSVGKLADSTSSTSRNNSKS